MTPASSANASARVRLVEATKALLWQQGIEATSPADILRNSGVGQGSLYHHFAGKPAIVATATASLAHDLQADTDLTLRDDTVPPLLRVRAYLTKHRDALRGCRLGRLTFDPGLDARTAEPIAAYFTDLQETLAGLLSRAHQDGDWDASLPADEVATTITATVQGGYVLAAATGDPAVMDRAVNGALALLDAAPHTTAERYPSRTP